LHHSETTTFRPFCDPYACLCGTGESFKISPFSMTSDWRRWASRRRTGFLDRTFISPPPPRPPRSLPPSHAPIFFQFTSFHAMLLRSNCVRWAFLSSSPRSIYGMCAHPAMRLPTTGFLLAVCRNTDSLQTLESYAQGLPFFSCHFRVIGSRIAFPFAFLFPRLRNVSFFLTFLLHTSLFPDHSRWGFVRLPFLKIVASAPPECS